MSAAEKIGRTLSKVPVKAGKALKKAAMKRDQMERQFDKVFGKDALRGAAHSSSRVREKAAMSHPSSSSFFQDNRNKDEGVKEEKYFGDVDKSKLVSADMDGKDEGVQQNKFFGKSDKYKKIDPW